MAFTSTTLDITPKSIFTSNGSNAITTMYICNTGNIEAQFSIYAVPSGTVADDSKVIYYQVPLTQKDTYVVDTEKLVLEDGDSLYASILDPYSTRTVALMETDWRANTGPITTSHWAPDIGQYMIGGIDGKIAISKTGESWAYVSGLKDIGWPNGIDVKDITRIPGKNYIAVGDAGTMAVSDNGIAWSNLNVIGATAWGSSNINAIANNGSIYMMVGDNALVASSTDGLNWEIHIGLTGLAWGTANVHSIIWDGTQFVLGGDGGRIAATVDGTLFIYRNSLRNNPAWGESTRITSLIYSGFPDVGYLVLSADNNKAAWSLNGSTWTYDSSLADLIGANVTPGIADVTYRPGYGFYAIGYSSEIYEQDAARIWYRNTSLSTPPWNAVAGTTILWNPFRAEFLAGGFASKLATSTDGLNWAYRTEYISSNVILPNVVVTVSSIGI